MKDYKELYQEIYEEAEKHKSNSKRIAIYKFFKNNGNNGKKIFKYLYFIILFLSIFSAMFFTFLIPFEFETTIFMYIFLFIFLAGALVMQNSILYLIFAIPIMLLLSSKPKKYKDAISTAILNYYNSSNQKFVHTSFNSSSNDELTGPYTEIVNIGEKLHIIRASSNSICFSDKSSIRIVVENIKDAGRKGVIFLNSLFSSTTLLKYIESEFVLFTNSNNSHIKLSNFTDENKIVITDSNSTGINSTSDEGNNNMLTAYSTDKEFADKILTNDILSYIKNFSSYYHNDIELLIRNYSIYILICDTNIFNEFEEDLYTQVFDLEKFNSYMNHIDFILELSNQLCDIITNMN